MYHSMVLIPVNCAEWRQIVGKEKTSQTMLAIKPAEWRTWIVRRRRTKRCEPGLFKNLME
jgi:hypothetical protein